MREIIRSILLCLLIILFGITICAGASFKEPFSKGIEASNEGDYEKAIVEFEKCIQLDEDNPRPHIALAIVYVNLKEFEKALQFAHQAISIDSSQGIAYYIMGMIFEKLKRFDDAIDAWKIYLTLEPEGRRAEIAKKHLEKLTEEREGK